MSARVDIRGAVAVPLLQALATALLVALLATVAAFYFEASKPWLIGIGVFSVVAIGAWTAYRGEWRVMLEAELGILASPPPAQANELRVTVASADGMSGDFLHLADISREQLEALARGLQAGKSLSVHSWTGRRAPFSRPQFERLRGELASRGFVRLRSENSVNSGYELTSRGRALVRALAESHSSSRADGGREAVIAR